MQPGPEYDSETCAVERYVIPKVRLRWYAIVIGGVEQSFTIEQPGIASHGIDVLGAEVVHTQEHDGLLTLFLNKPVKSPAVVVRFNLL